MKRRSKYGNRKTVVDGITFDSAAEARRYGELRLLRKAQKIMNLEVHAPMSITVNGVKICRYVADFIYYDCAQKREVVEDVKSGPTKTAVYRLKKKLVKAVFGIDITEIDA